MNGERTAGALQYPAYLLVWSIGVLFFTGGFYRADAALVSSLPIAFEPLASVPMLVTDGEFRVHLNTALIASEVMAGNWQPTHELVEEASLPAHLKDQKLPVDVADDAVPAPETHEDRAPEAAIPRSAEPVIDASSQAEVPGISVLKREQSVKASVARAPAAAASMEKRSVSSPAARVSEEVVALRREARKALAGGDSRRAFRLLMQNVRVAGSDKEYLALLAVAALEQRLPREALLVYEKLIKLDRLDSRWWMGLAVCQERLGVDATAIYEEVVRLTEKGSEMQRLALDRLDLAGGVT